MTLDLPRLVRPNILRLTPYSCARNEYTGGEATVFLDANENPYGAPYNRYPDPLQRQLKEEISSAKGLPTTNIFLGNGSDEAIDILYRIFCEPHVDNVVAMAPTYGMYEVCANINAVSYRPVPLNSDFSLSAARLLSAVDEHSKMVWLCSPNNPTGNSLSPAEIDKVLTSFTGIVVVDEAYIDFSAQPSYRFALSRCPNLVVLHTMSKAWAAASLRLGMAFAASEIVALMNKVKYPYNIGLPTQQKASEMLRQQAQKDKWVAAILAERERLMAACRTLRSVCEEVYPTDANFFLVRVPDANAVYDHLIRRGIVVRNRSMVELCNNMMRITVGSPEENDRLLCALRQYI